jgi:RNA polymerase sigma-70 factor, ECF subfamily
MGRRRLTSFDHLNTAEYVAELQQGSEQAFSRLMSEISSPLFWFLATRMDMPEATAEEIAADTLFAVHQKVKTFRVGGKAKLTTWIFEIAKNRAIDYHRAAKPKIQELDAATCISHEETNSDTEEKPNEKVLWIREQLLQLSDEDRQILTWRALEFSFRQIGEWLGISEGLARVRHKRALDRLKQQSKKAVLPGRKAQ